LAKITRRNSPSISIESSFQTPTFLSASQNSPFPLSWSLLSFFNLTISLKCGRAISPAIHFNPDRWPNNFPLNSHPQFPQFPQFSMSGIHFTSKIIMFSLFYDPPVYSYYTYDPFALHRRQYQRARYLNYLENQIASLFNDEFVDLCPESQSTKCVPPPDDSVKASTSGTSETSATAKPETPESVDKTPSAEKTTSTEKQVSTPRRYQYFSSRTFNGSDYVGEHRERVVSSDGEVHVRTRRQLGDRWHEVETHTDREGKNTERETWHNVGDDDIEKFKNEWVTRHPNKESRPVEQSTPTPESLKDQSESAKHD
jgi:hypothetical protein